MTGPVTTEHPQVNPHMSTQTSPIPPNSLRWGAAGIRISRSCQAKGEPVIKQELAIGQVGQGPQSNGSDKVIPGGQECQKRVLVTGSLSLPCLEAAHEEGTETEGRSTWTPSGWSKWADQLIPCGGLLL